MNAALHILSCYLYPVLPFVIHVTVCTQNLMCTRMYAGVSHAHIHVKTLDDHVRRDQSAPEETENVHSTVHVGDSARPSLWNRAMRGIKQLIFLQLFKFKLQFEFQFELEHTNGRDRR